MSDLISRQDAIKVSLEFFVEYLGGAFDEKLQDRLKEELETFPSTEPKKIRGRWITDKQGYVTCSAICNKCGKRTQMLDGYYNFCPHCGMKMEK